MVFQKRLRKIIFTLAPGLIFTPLALSICLVALTLTNSDAKAVEPFPNLQILTEEWPPFQYTDNGELKGKTVGLLTAILKEAGSELGPEDVQVLPWARAYLKVQREPNTVLFSTTRTPERENLFKWVGPILKNDTYFIGKKDRRYNIQKSSDLHGHRVGVIIGDASAMFARRHAIPEQNLTFNSRADINMKMLEADRIDFVVTGWTAFEVEAENAGADLGNYERTFLADSSHVSFAFNLNTPDDMVAKFDAAYETVVATGAFDNLISSEEVELN